MCSTILKPGVYRHITCRNNIYPRSLTKRYPVPDDVVFWSVPYNDYDPPEFTSSLIKGRPWADPEDINATYRKPPLWNQTDGSINRASFNGTYEIENGLPVNPIGRTGLRGRGLLGRWGPNHAADPVVTRWKRDEAGNVVRHEGTDKCILQMLAIQRRDNKMWAIPGGMVDPGEKVSHTLMREFMEEAMDSDEQKDLVDEFFSGGVEIYKGYVDDYRNTDNAWMETVAYSFHDDSGDTVGKMRLSAGDDAANVKWTDVNGQLKLHANHANIVKKVVERLNAYW